MNFWQVLDTPMKYAESNFVAEIRTIDMKNRVILPSIIKEFYKGKCKITMSITDGTIIIRPI